MKVVNLFGGPGIGKSTVAAAIFHTMKLKGYRCELIVEYAKELVYANRPKTMSDQLYLLAKQNHRLFNLIDHDLQYVISDSPLLLCTVYRREQTSDLFKQFVVETFDSYNNINFLLVRDTETPYQQYGRSQTLEQAQAIDTEVRTVLDNNRIPYIEIRGQKETFALQVFDAIKKIEYNTNSDAQSYVNDDSTPFKPSFSW